MQGLPVNLLTKTTKVENTSGKNVVAMKGNEDESSSFSSLFSNLVGPSQQKTSSVEASVEGMLGKQITKEGEVSKEGAETKVDLFLKAKSEDQNKRENTGVMTAEQAMPASVMKGLDDLLLSTGEIKVPVAEKIASVSSNLDQILKALKVSGEEAGATEVQLEDSKSPAIEKNTKLSNPLDFILNETKSNDVGAVAKKGSAVSMLGLSGEDFVKNLEAVETKEDSKKGLKNLSKEESSIEALLGKTGNKDMPNLEQLSQRQLNSSMKSYGQKQELLSNNLIKNTNDLAFKDKKTASSDELKNSDLKIGADLSSVKESFIPLMQKQEQQTNLETNNSAKVLDLSKIDASNTNEIIKRISDYIEQSQVAGKDSLDLTVKHESLGQFKIQVNKQVGQSNGQMDMQITTSTAEGHEFFMKNEIGLMKNLSTAGIQLSDLRIVSGGSESMSFSQSDSKQSGNSQTGSQGPKEFMSFDSGDLSQGSERRKALWQEYQQRYGA
jgi:hypothetical protein